MHKGMHMPITKNTFDVLICAWRERLRLKHAQMYEHAYTLLTSMHICVRECMYRYLHIHIHACTCACAHLSALPENTEVPSGEATKQSTCMYSGMYVCMYVSMYVCMHVYMYICMYICLF